MNFGGTIRLNRVGVCVICGLLILVIIYLSPRGDAEGQGPSKQSVNLRRLLIASIEAAERGGKEVVRTRKDPSLNEKSKGKTKEGAESLVTNADYRSHCVMYYGIRGVFQGVKVISEEKSTENDCKKHSSLEIDPMGNAGLDNLPDEEVDASKVGVWIDPLDATQEYTENILDCVTTMVCVTYEGNPIIGVIHKPFGKEPKTTWAWLNKGQSPHLKPKKNENETKTIIVSRSHPGEVEKMLKEAFGENTNIVHSGGAGYKVLEVVSGNASAYVHTTAIQKWDICAGDAIITSVGGRMSTLTDGEIDYSVDYSVDYSTWSPVVNKGGILTTLKDHSSYIEKIKKVWTET